MIKNGISPISICWDPSFHETNEYFLKSHSSWVYELKYEQTKERRSFLYKIRIPHLQNWNIQNCLNAFWKNYNNIASRSNIKVFINNFTIAKAVNFNFFKIILLIKLTSINRRINTKLNQWCTSTYDAWGNPTYYDLKYLYTPNKTETLNMLSNALCPRRRRFNTSLSNGTFINSTSI